MNKVTTLLVIVAAIAFLSALLYISIPTRPEVTYRACASKLASYIRQHYLQLVSEDREPPPSIPEFVGQIRRFDPEFFAQIERNYTLAIAGGHPSDLNAMKNEIVCSMTGREKTVIFYGGGTTARLIEDGAIPFPAEPAAKQR